MRNRRLLLSANDPGAAFHLCELTRYAREFSSIQVTALAGSVAFAIFKQGDFLAHPFTSGRTDQNDSIKAHAILEEAATMISKFSPDAILVGLSGPDKGVDEALIAQAGHIPTYAIQDFWGDVNEGFGRLPDTYFVVDEMAAAMTRLRAPLSRIVVTGSARHAALAALNPVALRDQFRSSIGASSSDLVGVFFGQPLWEFTGYATTISKATRALMRINPNAKVLYRAHPKEHKQQYMQGLEFLKLSGLSLAEDTAPSVEHSLCGADLSLSCYSSCGMELAYLNRISPYPLGIILYLLCESDIRSSFFKSSGLEDMPHSTMGFAATVREDTNIETSIRNSLMESARERVRIATRRKLSSSTNAARKILDTIFSTGQVG